MLCNLRAGIRAALLLRVNYADLRVSLLQLAALTLLLLLPPLLFEYLQAGSKGEFTSYGLPDALFLFPFGFIVATISAVAARRREMIPALLIIFLATSIGIDALTLALPYIFKFNALTKFYRAHYNIIMQLPGWWLALAVAAAWTRLLSLPIKRAQFVYFALTVFLILPLNRIWLDRTLWSRPYSETETARQMTNYNAPLQEDVLYLQPKLLNDALAQLQPGRNATVDLYFVGFAPYAEQSVFKREISSVETLLRTRFDTATHAITLINNAGTLHKTPLATVTALELALKRVGQVMNPDEDILFLYLTSHGSREHHLSVQFTPLKLVDLTPEQLRKMLDAAGIKWRVIAISACYSGGFIDALKTDNTLVMTAAAADKTSFGCSDEESFTYFGKAYFDEALRKTASFIDAFAIAKASVTAREKAGGYDPSNPQIALGKNIEAKLREFEKQIQPFYSAAAANDNR
ncbi:MAG TPA: C13 family peptidase [Spongiibacteraceae bacterium]